MLWRIKDTILKRHYAAGIKIGVLGDFGLDEYFHIDNNCEIKADYTNRGVVRSKSSVLSLGGAGNIVNNLRSLLIEVYCFGIVGVDIYSNTLLKLLSDIGANIDGFVVEQNYQVDRYIRPISNTITNLSEIASVSEKALSVKVEDKLLDNLELILPELDALIILEQFSNKNFCVINEKIRKYIDKISQRYPKIFVIADTKCSVFEYTNVISKCNYSEFIDNIKFNNSSRFFSLNKVEMDTRKGIVVTLGENGAIFIEDNNIHYTSAIKHNCTIDTCGAGDTMTSGIAVAMCLGLNMNEAILLGSIMSSITIEKLNVTGSCIWEEIFEKINFVLEEGEENIYT